MNSYSKLLQRILFAFGILLGSNALGIDISSFYVAACQRYTGVVLNVTGQTIQVLTLDGSVQSVPRYEIIYMATYPLDIVPIEKIQDPQKIPYIVLKTRQDDRLVDLVKGWPVDFTEDRISFLNLTGQGFVVDRDNIWGLEVQQADSSLNFSNNIHDAYLFTHPYPFANCRNTPVGRPGAHVVKIDPQQLLGDPITIKRELDRLMHGHDQMQIYMKRQQFYPIPQLYTNDSSLGLWTSAGSRYGASSSRSNNFTPILRDERSLGAFSFQQVFLTGSAPLPQSIHEEPQAQIFYRFKADYFHLSTMIDPDLILVGQRYQWTTHDFAGTDDREVEMGQLEFGFDYGHFAVNFYGVGEVDSGAKYQDRFQSDTIPLPRVGLSYRAYAFMTDLQYGTGSGTNSQSLSFLRWNIWRLFSKQFDGQFSFIERNFKYQPSAGVNSSVNFQYGSTSLTAALYGTYRFSRSYSAQAFVSYEKHDAHFGITDTSQSGTNYYIKGGLNGTLTF